MMPAPVTSFTMWSMYQLLMTSIAEPGCTYENQVIKGERKQRGNNTTKNPNKSTETKTWQVHGYMDLVSCTENLLRECQTTSTGLSKKWRLEMGPVKLSASRTSLIPSVRSMLMCCSAKCTMLKCLLRSISMMDGRWRQVSALSTACNLLLKFPMIQSLMYCRRKKEKKGQLVYWSAIFLKLKE